MFELVTMFALFAAIGWIIVFSSKKSRMRSTTSGRSLGLYKGTRSQAQREASAALILILGWLFAVSSSVALVLLLLVALFLKK
ncbi:MAG: hypothetical protein LH614_13345 [Pyrinomonadaceae bacterium]|nr:hypothetical protein [Pyrinomonadaceae bacterium]